MTRKEFIQTACGACLGLPILATTASSCRSTRYVTGSLVNDGLHLRLEEFEVHQQGNMAYRNFLIIRNDALQYPVGVFRFGPNLYSALWMQCSHQGAELQASGDYLQCPAHGSEFNNRGEVKAGPADEALRSFPVCIEGDHLFIDMRKQS